MDTQNVDIINFDAYCQLIMCFRLLMPSNQRLANYHHHYYLGGQGKLEPELVIAYIVNFSST